VSSISGINAVFALSVLPLFPIPIQLQGFNVDEAFDVEDVEPNEARIGVDGIMSAGRVAYMVPMTIGLMADSASNAIFDQWNQAEQAIGNTYFAMGVISLKAIGSKWALTKGVLSRYKPMPGVKKLLEPRHFRLTWNYIQWAPV
jgi:hypothetical protein